MILSPADIRALEKVCELTQFRKGHPRVFLGKRVRGPGGKGWLARQLDMSRMSVVRMLRGNQVSDEYALRALSFLRELRTDSPEIFVAFDPYEPRIGRFTRSQWIDFAVAELGLTESRAESTFDFMFQDQRRQQIASVSVPRYTTA